MSIQHCFYVFANRNAEFFGRVRNDAQSFAELTFRIFAECSACVASSFCQSGGSIRSLIRNPVQNRTSPPAEMIPAAAPILIGAIGRDPANSSSSIGPGPAPARKSKSKQVQGHWPQ